MQTVAKWTHLEAIHDLEAFKSMHKNSWKTRNLRKSTKILDEYPTKMHENSCFEHVQVTLCKKSWFSCPERFWPRSGNTLHQSPKFRGFWTENWSDPCKIRFSTILSDFCIHGVSKATPGITKMNAFLCIFAGRSTACVFYHCNTGLRIFHGHFVMNFRRFLAILASMAWAKQYRERQKWTQFEAFSQIKRRRAFLTIVRPGCIFFHVNFAVILDAFWRHFAWFCASVWKPGLGLWMVLGAGQNA